METWFGQIIDQYFWLELFALVSFGVGLAFLAHRSECYAGMRPRMAFVTLQTVTLLFFASLPGVTVGVITGEWDPARVNHLLFNRVVFVGVFLLLLVWIRRRETKCK